MRRLVLLACLLVLTGCQSAPGPGTPSPTSTPTPTPSGPPTASVANGSDAPSEFTVFRSDGRTNGTADVVTVSREGAKGFEGSVDLILWNDAPRDRPINITFAHVPTNETLYQREGIPANEAVEFDLLGSGRYALSVTTNATTEALSIERDTFDCNSHTFGVRIDSDGTVSTTEVSTEMLCEPPGE